VPPRFSPLTTQGVCSPVSVLFIYRSSENELENQNWLP
jgi:hypothetical protein